MKRDWEKSLLHTNPYPNTDPPVCRSAGCKKEIRVSRKVKKAKYEKRLKILPWYKLL